ncbi:MAG: MGMT family protein [Cryomorphaceae bacterium]|nr:MGMT family protein [Cryomorphaceae bacterium]
MSKSNDFFARVYAVVHQIPHGRVTSYGAIAEYLGSKSSSRVVGYALNAAAGTDVPAHRVVNRNGLLTGKHHFPGSTMMADLLKSEGVAIKNDQVVDFKSLFWDPRNAL